MHRIPASRNRPIIFASGLWLLARQWPEVAKVAKAPPLPLALAALGPALLLYLFGRMIGVLGIEMFALMATLYAAVFAFGGGWVYVGLWQIGAPGWLALVACVVITAGLRGLALWRDWRLPTWRT